MVGWDVSRHPEWDMMYKAGLTVREIADRCHQNVATVHLHLQVREKYQPGLRAAHESALNDRDPDRPSTKWRKCLEEVIHFQADHGRPPRNEGGSQEQRMSRWIAAQRRAFNQGKMSKAKEVLLDSLSDWLLDTHQQELDERWRVKLLDLQDFVSEFGTMPRYKNFASEREHTLGVWLHNQHQRRAEQKLDEWRLEAINVAIPGWTSRM